MKSKSSNPLIKQLSVCGQIAEQQNQLGTLLTILQKHWLVDHAAHHQK